MTILEFWKHIWSASDESYCETVLIVNHRLLANENISLSNKQMPKIFKMKLKWIAHQEVVYKGQTWDTFTSRLL